MAVVKCKRTDPEAPLLALSATQASALVAYAEQVLPGEGERTGVARYVDRLLSEVDPVIGSNGAPVPLDRVAKAAWALRVVALKEQLEPVLAAGKPLAMLGAEDRELVCSLVTEAAFTRAEYGGGFAFALIGSEGPVMPAGFVSWDGENNVERADAPVSTAEPGTDGHPLDQSTRDLLDEVARATGGRIR